MTRKKQTVSVCFLRLEYRIACLFVRFEKLIEGIQACEKVRVLREEFINAGNAVKLAELDALLQKFGLSSQYSDDFSTLIRSGQSELNRLSR